MKNKMTTIFGLFTAFAGLAHQTGLTVGHIGSGDFVSLAGVVSMALFGYFAKDAGAAAVTPAA